MIGNKPVTREYLLEILDRPEMEELKQRLESNQKHKEIIIELIIEFDKHFDSLEELQAAFDAWQNKKTVSA